MSEKVRIRTDFPTEKQIASQLKLSAGRVAELRKQLFELHVTHPDGSVTIFDVKSHQVAGKVRSGRKSMRSTPMRTAKRR